MKLFQVVYGYAVTFSMIFIVVSILLYAFQITEIVKLFISLIIILNFIRIHPYTNCSYPFSFSWELLCQGR